MKYLVIFLVASCIFSFVLANTTYAQEQKQFQVITKMNFPESIPTGKPVDFTIDITYKGPYSWVKNLEPKFEIVPSRAHYDVDIQYDDSISDYTVWKGHIHTLHGTIHVSEDTPFDAVFLSVSFEGVVRFDDAVVSVDPDSTISLSIGKSQQETTSKTQFHKGHVEWISRCFMVGSDVVLRVTDPDMNYDSDLVEEFNVTIWSDNDDRKIAYTVTETGKDTGVFDANVFFTTTDSSPGKRLRIVDGSTVFAKYTDYTFSESYKATDVINSVVTSGLSVLERHTDGSVSQITYDPCALMLFAQNHDQFEQMDVFYPPPLKQISSGLSGDEVRCKESFSLMTKHDGSPACVTESTKQKLVERGWTTKDNSVSKTSTNCMTPEQSKETAPFFKTPSYLPEGYSHVCSQSGTPSESYIVYHNQEIQYWNIPELISDGAIFIHQIDERNMMGDQKFQTYGSPEQRIQETYDSVMKGNPSLNPQLITINGMLAYAVDSCPDCGMQIANFTDGTSIQKSTSTETKIKFIDENGVTYMLKTTLPLSELVKVAESLQ